MSKKKTKLYTIQPEGTSHALVIDQNKMNRAKADHSVNFRTGGYMTEKDRPRKKYKPRDVEGDF